jgi:hypothetical protein
MMGNRILVRRLRLSDEDQRAVKAFEKSMERRKAGKSDDDLSAVYVND